MNWEETIIKLNRGGILSDTEVEYYNRGAEAQAKLSYEAGERKVIKTILTYPRKGIKGKTEWLNISVPKKQVDKWQAKLNEEWEAK